MREPDHQEPVPLDRRPQRCGRQSRGVEARDRNHAGQDDGQREGRDRQDRQPEAAGPGLQPPLELRDDIEDRDSCEGWPDDGSDEHEWPERALAQHSDPGVDDPRPLPRVPQAREWALDTCERALTARRLADVVGPLLHDDSEEDCSGRAREAELAPHRQGTDTLAPAVRGDRLIRVEESGRIWLGVRRIQMPEHGQHEFLVVVPVPPVVVTLAPPVGDRSPRQPEAGRIRIAKARIGAIGLDDDRTVGHRVLGGVEVLPGDGSVGFHKGREESPLTPMQVGTRLRSEEAASDVQALAERDELPDREVRELRIGQRHV